MNAPNPSLAKFRLGHIVATPNALAKLSQEMDRQRIRFPSKIRVE